MNDSIGDRLSKLSSAKRALLQRRLSGNGAQAHGQIPAASRDAAIQASFSQERMWLFQKMYPDAIPYNSQVAIHFTGALDVGALERALSELVRRHEIYRTSFKEVDGSLVQQIHDPHAAHLRKADLSQLRADLREPAVRELIRHEISRPFRLDQIPLVRWTLIVLDSSRHILVCADHHAVTDGWSRNVELKEMMALYSHYSSSRGADFGLAPPRLQFADFAAWQRQWMAGAEAHAQIDFWKRKLADCPALLDLPYDRAHPLRPSFRGGHEMMLLGEQELRPLREAAARAQATMFMTVLAVFLVLLHRTSRADDICVGTGIANRRMPDLNGLIGMLINTVVLRADLAGNPGFGEVLRRVRALTLEAYANQEAPFEKVVEAVAPVRQAGINPLHQVSFNFQNNPMPALHFAGLEASLERPLFNGSAKFDLYVAGWPRSEERRGAWQRDDEAVLLSWEYNADVFDVATIRQMQAHFRSILVEIGKHPERPIGDLRMDDGSGLESAPTATVSQSGASVQCESVHGLFEKCAANTPDATAVIFGERSWTYRELDRRAESLATHLRALGAGPDGLIAICIERSPEMIAGLLGILKAGGAYVPLDPAYPAARLASMLEKCRPHVVLTTDALAALLPCGDAHVVIAEDAFAQPASAPQRMHSVSPEHLAYLAFTSGSTGEARAVAVPHRSVIRLVRGAGFASMDADQTWLQLSPLAFDASTLEIWGPLCNGGRLVLMGHGLPSLDDIGATIRQHKVTSAWLTAGLFQLMAEDRLEDFAGLRQLLTGGDVVPIDAARRVVERFPDLRLINGYGPTENTTFTCCHTIERRDLSRRSLPIGRAITGTTVHILDANGRTCPTGVPGELCAGGAGLARGYLNDPESTAEKFVEHAEFGRLYHSGDLCRRLSGGAIEFLGRMDRQAKVRGFRIEPGEVEAALRRCPGVAHCVVVVRGETAAKKFLAAYLVPQSRDRLPTVDELRDSLRQSIPEHAHPSSYQFLEALPLTPNGKIDRDALPAVAASAVVAGRAPEAARTPLEEIVLGVWQDVLVGHKLGIQDDFFACGGHSLAALRVLALVKARTGIAMKALDFFEQPTIAGFAARAQRRIDNPAAESGNNGFLVELRSHGTGSPLFIVPGGWGEANEILVFAGLLRHLGANRALFAVRSRALDSSRPLPQRLEQQADDVLQAIAAVAAQKPLVIIGECAASTMALALAALAERQGRSIDAIILLDPGPVAHLRSVVERIAIQANGFDGQPRSGTLPLRLTEYYRLLGTWQPQPLRSPLHLILSCRFPDVEAVRLSWLPLAAGALHVHRVAGDHVSYIREHGPAVASLIDAILSGRDD